MKKLIQKKISQIKIINTSTAWSRTPQVPVLNFSVSAARSPPTTWKLGTFQKVNIAHHTDLRSFSWFLSVTHAITFFFRWRSFPETPQIFFDINHHQHNRWVTIVLVIVRKQPVVNYYYHRFFCEKIVLNAFFRYWKLRGTYTIIVTSCPGLSSWPTGGTMAKEGRLKVQIIKKVRIYLRFFF